MVSETILNNLYQKWLRDYKKDENSLPIHTEAITKYKMGNVLSRISSSLESRIPEELKGTVFLRIDLKDLTARWMQDKEDKKEKPAVYEAYDLGSALEEESYKQGFCRRQSEALSVTITNYLFKMGMNLSDEVRLVQNSLNIVWLKKDL